MIFKMVTDTCISLEAAVALLISFHENNHETCILSQIAAIDN